MKNGSWCCLDLKDYYSNGYFRQLVSEGIKKGRIAKIEPRACPQFYRVKDVYLSSNDDYLTTDRMEDRVEAIKTYFKILGHREPAIHDIRLLGHACGLHAASMDKGPMNDVSKDIRLIDWKIDAWRIVRVVVHNNDRFTVMLACSNKPLVANAHGVLDLYAVLGRVQERMINLVGIGIDIPNLSLWQLRALHENIDYYCGIGLPAGLVITTRDLAGALIRMYTKQLPGEPKPVLRIEELTGHAKDSKPLWQKASELLSDATSRT